MKLKLESWSALAPQLDSVETWRAWFDRQDAEQTAAIDVKPIKLKQIPPLLRRRFSKLGKYAASAILKLDASEQSLTRVYASRHGDTALTLSLLNNMGLEDEPMSPTDFSLAVHNAIGGLMSIAQKDHAPMTAIASMDRLVLSCLQEAYAQLEVFDKVLCVLYDAELPELYARYCDSLPFPVAVAFVVSRSDHGELSLSSQSLASTPDQQDSNILDLVAMLVGKKQSLSFFTGNSQWTLSLDLQQ
jgi:hypothetical protein